ncbi:DEAD/DEAH box helicase family protein [Zunongwangia pacifica]|uniref:DEAD/DEAH box helicase family protein n=1 Tax=Zunongwangia pacifica TaxID=2911062 RepID=A0A9X2CPS9_9FLAO|nr:DEAD/DEAH box helicase family protein [Zunongwangia pacifica]MCL6218598.1 DEAD/DEAH box helicase family protein [Zunongwangia pacifica]
MIIKDIPIEGIPIEFKEINPKDFDKEYYNVPPKQIITPDKKGFIKASLSPILEADLENKNTTIINAGVGQGKTRAILNVIGKYSKLSDYVVIIAVPYNSLIEQYVDECSSYVPKEKIFNLLNYTEHHKKPDSKSNKKSEWGFTSDEEMIPISKRIPNYKVHVITTNALLENPGEDNLFTAKLRNEYFNTLRNHAKNDNKKIIWLFDEIHDSIHNFKEHLIVNLWKYHGLIHKSYIISATFNEASKEVIKYISEFTDKKIFIIESERIPCPEKQSNLHINFYSSPKLERDSSFTHLVESLLEKSSPFDILVYSKTLAEKLTNPKKKDISKVKNIPELLKPHIHRINKCYSNPFNPTANKKYNSHSNIINIGTNFSTGINIKEKDHNLIILLPRELGLDYVNNKGVFTNGANTIIQALARQRKEGDIHIFSPNPEILNKESLPYNDDIKERIQSIFTTYKKDYHKHVDYTNLNKQKNVLDNTYKKLISESKEALENINNVNRTGLNRLLYPTKEIFTISQGEKYLSKEYFGGSLPTYIFWAAITNQFLNCKLKTIETSSKINLERENLYSDTKDLIDSEIEIINSLSHEFNLFDSFSHYEKLEFIKDFHHNADLYINNEKASPIENNNVLLMMMAYTFGGVEDFKSREAKLKMFTLYLSSCLHHSKYYPNKKDSINKVEARCILIFKKWNSLLDILEKNKNEVKERYRLPTTPTDEFKIEFQNLYFKEDLEYLIANETLLSTDIFQFKNTIQKSIKRKDTIESFYRLCIKTYYNSTSRQTSKDGKKISYYEVENRNYDSIPNLLYKPLPEVVL